MIQHFSSAGVDIAYSDGAATQVATDGRPRPPVLLIHGFASNMQANWADTGWTEALRKAGYRPVSYDNRGHGHSQKLYDPAEHGALLMAEDARRLLDHLAIPRAIVMGYSMGARIAGFLAVAHPERVAGVVFGGMGINLVRGIGGSGPIAAALEAPSIDDVTNPTARTFRAFAERTGSDLKALAACMRSTRTPFTAEDAARIRCPALVVVGSDDVIGGSAAELAALIPGAEAVALNGRDHMKAVGDAGYKRAVMDWLARLPG